MMKINWYTNIKFLIIAALIIIFAYFFGTIILITIGIIIGLISILFIISLLFNKTAGFLSNKNTKLFINMLFISLISILISHLFTQNIIIQNKTFKLTIIWIINAFIFGTLWNLIIIRKRIVKTGNIINYKESKSGIQLKDIIFMFILPTIITITYSIIIGII